MFKAILKAFKAIPTPFFKSSTLSTFYKAEESKLKVFVA